jgi:hypothetical protein
VLSQSADLRAEKAPEKAGGVGQIAQLQWVYKRVVAEAGRKKLV